MSANKEKFFDSKEKDYAGKIALTTAIPGGGFIGMGINAKNAKKGRKAAVAGRNYGRATAEGLGGAAGGAALGAGIGALTRRPGAALTGASVGSKVGGFGGVTHGLYRSTQNAQKRGDFSKSAFFVEDEMDISKSDSYGLRDYNRNRKDSIKAYKSDVRSARRSARKEIRAADNNAAKKRRMSLNENDRRFHSQKGSTLKYAGYGAAEGALIGGLLSSGSPKRRLATAAATGVALGGINAAESALIGRSARKHYAKNDVSKSAFFVEDVDKAFNPMGAVNALKGAAKGVANTFKSSGFKSGMGQMRAKLGQSGANMVGRSNSAFASTTKAGKLQSVGRNLTGRGMQFTAKNPLKAGAIGAGAGVGAIGTGMAIKKSHEVSAFGVEH